MVIPLERSLIALLVCFVLLTGLSAFTVATPLFGLSTVLGVSVLGSSVLGSSVLGSSVLGSSVMGSTIVEAYVTAISTSQVCLSLVLIGLLIYSELTNPSYGKLRSVFLELRRSWMPVSVLLLVLFFIIVGIKVWGILA
jgi:hypothetical protein